MDNPVELVVGRMQSLVGMVELDQMEKGGTPVQIRNLLLVDNLPVALLMDILGERTAVVVDMAERRSDSPLVVGSPVVESDKGTPGRVNTIKNSFKVS